MVPLLQISHFLWPVTLIHVRHDLLVGKLHLGKSKCVDVTLHKIEVRIIHLKQDFTGELSVERVQIVGIVLRDQVPVVVEANGRGRIVAAFVREFGVLEQRVHHVDCELEFVMFEILPDQIRIIRCDWSGDTPESCCCRRVRESTPSCP